MGTNFIARAHGRNGALAREDPPAQGDRPDTDAVRHGDGGHLHGHRHPHRGFRTGRIRRDDAGDLVSQADTRGLVTGAGIDNFMIL